MAKRCLKAKRYSEVMLNAPRKQLGEIQIDLAFWCTNKRDLFRDQSFSNLWFQPKDQNKTI